MFFCFFPSPKNVNFRRKGTLKIKVFYFLNNFSLLCFKSTHGFVYATYSTNGSEWNEVMKRELDGESIRKERAKAKRENGHDVMNFVREKRIFERAQSRKASFASHFLFCSLFAECICGAFSFIVQVC